MTAATRELTFTHTPWSVAASVVFVLTVAVLAFSGWKRSGWRASIGWLEFLRIVVAAGIFVAKKVRKTVNDVFSEATSPDHTPAPVVAEEPISEEVAWDPGRAPVIAQADGKGPHDVIGFYKKSTREGRKTFLVALDGERFTPLWEQRLDAGHASMWTPVFAAGAFEG